MKYRVRAPTNHRATSKYHFEIPSESREIVLSDLPDGRIELMCEPNLEFILDVIVDSPLESPS